MQKHAMRILRRSLKAFGLHPAMKTDPVLLQRLMREYRLETFRTRNKTMQRFFAKCRTAPQPLKPMLSSVQQGIASNHPAIVEFAELALRKRWFRRSKYPVEVVHRMYLLEALTAAMSNDHAFFVELQDHYKNEERKCGINTMHTVRAFLRSLCIVRSLFGTMKALSVDPLMIFFRLQRGFTKSHIRSKEAKQMLRDKKINFVEYALLSPLHARGLEHVLRMIRVNIYEAGVTEYRNNLPDNAFCAHFLSESIKKNPPRTHMKKGAVIPEHASDPLYKALRQKDNVFPVVAFSKDWASAYETWNLAFVVRNCDDMDLVLPKLLIPSVIDATHQHYISTRVIALWLTLNQGLFRRYEGRIVVGPKHKAAMASAWAAINKKHALAICRKETSESPMGLAAGFRAFFSHPLLHFFALMKRI